MPCLLAIIALGFPRLVILLLVVFSDYIGRAFGGEWLWPVLGFFLMPFTTLAYALGMNNGGIKGLYLVLLIVAVLMDFGAIGGGAAARRKRVVVVRKE